VLLGPEIVRNRRGSRIRCRSAPRRLTTPPDESTEAGAVPLTPNPGSWLNLVEAFFSILTRQAQRRGSFPTVTDLIAAIEHFIDAWNDRCAPFT
jgi:hypothetical protein